MPKSSGRSLFGSTNRGQTVTVIETPTRYSQRRKAIVAFWVTLFTVGLLTGTVASHYWHPILGALFGLVLGALLLAEPITSRLLIALATVAAGIFLVNRRAAPAQPRMRATSEVVE